MDKTSQVLVHTTLDSHLLRKKIYTGPKQTFFMDVFSSSHTSKPPRDHNHPQAT